MALMLGKLYDALRAGNVPEKEAREASVEVASYERDIAGIKTEVRVVQGVGGIVIVVLLAALWQLVALRGEVSAVGERVAGVATRLGELATQVDKRLGALEQGLDSIDNRLDGVERRLPAP